MVISITTFYTTTPMSQYPISVHLPFPSERSPHSLPERPASVCTSSTIGTPLSPHPYSLPATQNTLSRSQELIPPAFPAVLDSNLLLSARKIKAEFLRRDTSFARLIVTILAQRIELGILAPANGIGFPFTDNDTRKVCCLMLGVDLEIMQTIWMGFGIGF